MNYAGVLIEFFHFPFYCKIFFADGLWKICKTNLGQNFQFTFKNTFSKRMLVDYWFCLTAKWIICEGDALSAHKIQIVSVWCA